MGFIISPRKTLAELVSSGDISGIAASYRPLFL